MHIVYEKSVKDRKERWEKDDVLKYNLLEYMDNQPPTWIPISKKSILEIDILLNITMKESDYWESIDNLCRLGLSASYFEEGSLDFETENDSLSEEVLTSHGGYDHLCITALGITFVKICNYS